MYDIRNDEAKPVLLLFINLFLITFTYYVCKSIRGALIIQDLGADFLPYVWTISVVALFSFVSVYSKIVDEFPRTTVTAITSLFFAVCLLGINSFMDLNSPWVTVAFYVWGDLFSVVMLEQFWSASNEVFSTGQAKRLYGLVGSGAILGAMTGSGVVGWLSPFFGTRNMTYVSVFLLLVIVAISFAIRRRAPDNGGLGTAKPQRNGPPTNLGFWSGFKVVMSNRYLLLVALTLILSQVISSVIDFQFNKAVESYFTGTGDRTAFFGKFYTVMNLVSLFAMAFLFSPINRTWGVIAGLLVLPIANLVGAFALLVYALPVLVWGTKLLDSSLRYSINRGSRELLYTGKNLDQNYKAKAVIDMFGYRASKVLGAVLIIPFSGMGISQLNWVSMALIAVMLAAIVVLRKELKKDIPEIETESEAAPDLLAARGGSLTGELQEAHSMAKL